MRTKRVLISGMGIAGPTLAYWLLRYGFEPTLVEQAPRFRDNGYMIDFWGVGLDVAERMDLMPSLMGKGYQINEVRIVNDGGKRVAGFDANIFRKKLMGRFISIPRGDLAKLIFDRVAPCVETIFGDSIVGIDQGEDGVNVRFEHAPPRRFGSIAFGDERRFESFLGFNVAAFNAPNYGRRDEGAYVSYAVPGKQVARYALSDGQTGFLFIFRNDGRPGRGLHDPRKAKALVRTVFHDVGWECNSILEAMDASDDLYFDNVSQIHMENWSSGRVAVVGDAAYCPSLLAGEGSALAMAGAYILAGELKRAEGDYPMALRRYEALLRPYIERKQKGATRFGNWFAPKSRLAILIRNTVTSLMDVPVAANGATQRMLGDRFSLPDYG
jgi:2-polyprenyl-6-methoxyphenol hydroxylase-like FAD-dependent oxidoreductase